MDPAEKRALLLRVRQGMETELRTLVAAQRATQAGAVHEENKAESDKDTRATEAAYLARGQAARVADLETGLLHLTQVQCVDFSTGAPAAVGAIVRLRSERAGRVVFLLPAGAGTILDHGGAQIRVITPASPLGRALLGARRGDSIEVELSDRIDEYAVEDVQ